MSPSFDVLIWENPPNDKETPFQLYEVSKEFIDLSFVEAIKEYKVTDYYHKQLIKYNSSDEDADGEIIGEQTNGDYEN